MRAQRTVRFAVLAALPRTLASVATPAGPVGSGPEIRVPQDAPTLQLAITRAVPGATIVLAAGSYPGGNVVPPGKHDITIRGVDRNAVVLDGAGRRKNGIVVRADGVSILNMSAHNFLENAFYWIGGDRFRGSYLTAWNVGGYGIYVEDGEQGVLDHDYVSGAADAAYYIGECKPCRATISRVVARLSAVGYSGTNATGVVIRDSVWDRNGAGIVPNTYANEALPPQARTTIRKNLITNSGRARVPIRTALAGFIGIGVAIAGGNENAISGNRVTHSERYGIAVFPTARFVVFAPGAHEPGPPWRPRRNRIAGNLVTGSGRADLALWPRGPGPATASPRTPSGGRCRPASRHRTARADPQRATRRSPRCSPAPSASWSTRRRRHPPSYTSMPVPPRQPSMPASG